jgi:hypothetical protein
LPSGKVLESPRCLVFQTHLLQGFPYPGPVGLGGTPSQTQDPVPAHENHVTHREGKASGKLDGLWDVPDGLPVTAGWTPEKGYGPTAGLEDPQEETEQGGFPGTVRPDEGGERPGRHL